MAHLGRGSSTQRHSGMLFISVVNVHGPDIGLPRLRGQASSHANVAAPSDPRSERARRAHVVAHEMCYSLTQPNFSTRGGRPAMASTRRLAAILAADVAGYSRLMGQDEEGTHERLRAHLRDLINPKIEEHRGRIVKNTGDGMLAEFPSVVDAVRCAVEVQRGMIDREPDMPEERRIRFRIGVNLGDVIVEEHDIFGDGVNIAARLEALAEPGGICVSRVVRDQVRDRVDCTFEDMGDRSVKNIARPVRLYHVGIGPVAVQSIKAPDATVEASLPLPDKPSVAVLPFANMSTDPEQEFLADGIAEDIITALSRYPSLFVIARSSSFTYKGRAIGVKQIGHELGVRYVLEGSLRKAGNRIRVTAQLVEAETGKHVWAERYDRALADIFAVQDEITEAVTIAIAPVIADAEQHAPCGSRSAASMDGPLTSAGCGILIRSVRRTTLSQGSSFSRPSTSTRALPEVTRASVRLKSMRLIMKGVTYPKHCVRPKHWRAGRSRSMAPTRRPVHYSLPHSVGGATMKEVWPRLSALWQ